MVNAEVTSAKALHTEIKQQLFNVVDALSFEKLQQLLEFAALLRQRSELVAQPAQENLDEWEKAISRAESYWFALPKTVQQIYSGKVVAIINDQIVDSDPQLRSLKQRVRQQFPQQPVLYIEANAALLQPLVIRSPKLR